MAEPPPKRRKLTLFSYFKPIKQENSKTLDKVEVLIEKKSEIFKKPEFFEEKTEQKNTTMNNEKLSYTERKPVVIDDLLPLGYKDAWNNRHCKLPCSPMNTYKSKSKILSKWYLIRCVLSEKIESSTDLEEAILSYNQTWSKKWRFDLLHELFTVYYTKKEVDHFFGDVLPKMQQLALQLPLKCLNPIPLLRKGIEKEITLSQESIACLLCHAFFCTFPRRNSCSKRTDEYYGFPTINFNNLYRGMSTWDGNDDYMIEKLKTILHYFKCVTKNMPKGNVAFHRVVLNDFVNFDKSDKLLCKLEIREKGNIEDVEGVGQVDFANKIIGGGVISRGCVQEEIRFLISPECIISRLFTEELQDNECLIIRGSQRFAKYSGYSETFKFAGHYEQDEELRKKTEIIAIDAINFRNKQDEQYLKKNIDREIRKAYCGFKAARNEVIATGLWGCGAFGGDKYLKSLIQIIAASQANKSLIFYTYNDETFAKDLQQMHSILTLMEVSVGELYNAIITKPKDVLLFHHVRDFLFKDEE